MGVVVGKERTVGALMCFDSEGEYSVKFDIGARIYGTGI
jgi:hypothetical protein